MKYAVVEIAGRQYKVEPNKAFTVDSLGVETKNFECDKVLLLANDKLEVGNPYLKEKLNFEILENKREPKIRVATYSAKANTRKVRGSRRVVSKIVFKINEAGNTVKKDKVTKAVEKSK